MGEYEENRVDLTEQELAQSVAYFGGDENGKIGDAIIQWAEAGHAGYGWYITCSEYPDEGAIFISGERELFPALARLLNEQTERDAKEKI